MEATFFRLLVSELIPVLQGRRIQKVFAPASGIWNMKLGADLFLLFGTTHQCPFLFLARDNPGNPPTPPAQVMWLRKRLNNRRILSVLSDWPRRVLALKLSPGEGTFLLIEPSSPPRLTDELPAEFGAEPEWPDLEEILNDARIWRRHPQLSPPLRRRLAELPREEAQDLLNRLARGDTASFTVQGDAASGKLSAVPWNAQGEQTFSALEAAACIGRSCLTQALDGGVAGRRENSKARKRLLRNLQRVDQDLSRMERLREFQNQALLLKAALPGVDTRAKQSSILISQEGEEERTITLDPALTVVENMERMFRQTAKGKRGLAFLARRKEALEQELARLDRDLDPTGPTISSAPVQGGKGKQSKVKSLSALARFRTSDGFLLLRGRNKKANHKLLTREAKPFDLWFHVQDGPGAHVILKRDHGEQEVPEQSMAEAAIIAALASFSKGSDQARVMCARVRDVRTIKGAEPGTVRVDRILASLNVRLDPELETRLSF
jgi:predicted ribosome quality control (RQC) complex YloA/Tae2 family protein